MSKPILSTFEEWSNPVGRPYLGMYEAGEEPHTYKMGIYTHPLGLVRVYQQVGKRPHTALSLVVDGKVYNRTWPHALPDRTISRIAREFIENPEASHD